MKKKIAAFTLEENREIKRNSNNVKERLNNNKERKFIMKKHFTTQKMSPTKIIFSFVFLLCFTMPVLAASGMMFTLFNVHLGKYVHNYYEGSWKLLPTYTGVGDYETFYKVDSGDGSYVYFKCAMSGKYITLDAQNNLVATVTTPGNNEKFLWVASGSHWAIKAKKNGLYVSANSYGSNWPLQATKSTITDWEQFNELAVVDMWKALRAFGVRHPNMIKISSHHNYPYIWPGNVYSQACADWNTGAHYWYWVVPDFSYDPLGLPGYDRNEIVMVGQWKYFGCRSTLPCYNVLNGGRSELTRWIPTILRTKCYCSPNLDEFTVQQETVTYHCASGCALRDDGGRPLLGGRRRPAAMRNYSNSNSSINMGWRWVVDLELTTRSSPNGNGEFWTVDLGPAAGVFDPEFGILEYGQGAWRGQTNDIIYSNVQNKDYQDPTSGAYPWRQYWYTNYPMTCNP